MEWMSRNRGVSVAFSLVLMMLLASWFIPVKGEAASPSSASWGVYIHAHQDDWQLYQSPSSYYDFQAGKSLLIIYTTAGDSGYASSWWQAREEGAKASVKWMAGTQAESSGWIQVCYGTPAPVCHNVWDWTYGRVTSVFMRLPDGNHSGNGFPRTGYVSLSKLRDGKIASLMAVDGSTTYHSWADFYTTLKAIVDTYAPHDSTTSVHAPDFDRVAQTSQDSTYFGWADHPDHLATADAVHAMTVSLNAPWNLFVFIDYPISLGADPRYPPNMNVTDYTIKKNLFMEYSNRVKATNGFDEYATDPGFWEHSFHRSYSRTVVVGPPPPLSVSFTSSPSKPGAGESISFTGTTSGGTSPFVFSWIFGDGSSGSGASVSHGYASAGTFTVKLTVTDEANQIASASESIAVTPRLAPAFTFSPSQPVAGDSISFSGSASGGTPPYAYSWAFGDGGAASGSSATHAYRLQGSFLAILTVSDSANHIAHVSKTISVSPPFAIDFTSSPSNPDVGESISFSGTAAGGASPYVFNWTFGDGATGRGATVGHAYSAAKSFAVDLQVSDSKGRIALVTKSVAVTPSLATDFTFGPSKPMAGEAVSFSATGTGGTSPYSYAWGFGDGGTGMGASVTHAFASEGNYALVLTTHDAAGHVATVRRSISVTPALSGDLVFAPAKPVINETVNFSANATGATPPYTFTWTFGDGSTGNGATVAHAYGTVTSFDVTLNITDSAGHVLVRTTTIAVAPPLRADFTFSPMRPMTGEGVSLSAQATGAVPPYAYRWTFGDASSGAGASVLHAYASTGSFTITLVLSDSAGHVAILTKPIVVSPPLVVDFAFSPVHLAMNDTVYLAAAATGGTSPYTYRWDLGDGNSSSMMNVSHAYTAASIFAVTLTVSDSAGHAVAVAKSIPVAHPLAADFAISQAKPTLNETVNFSANATGATPPYTFTWTFGDGSRGNGAAVAHAYGAVQSFAVTLNITDSAGHVLIRTATIAVAPPLRADFTISPTNPGSGAPVSVSPTVSGGTAPYTYAWSFGDGGSSLKAQPEHAYGGSGLSATYTIRLVVCDSAGHCTSVSDTLTVWNWPIITTIAGIAGVGAIASVWTLYLRRARLR